MDLKKRILLSVFVVVIGACGGDSAETVDSPATETTSSTSVESTSVTAASEEASPDRTTAPDQSPSLDLSLDDLFAPIVTEPTEPGPRPLLAWEPVEGAAVYNVVVLGSDGDPYWAWSGTVTEVHVGGIDEPEALGAWVHEPMTWTVSAQAGGGEVLALSAAAPLVP